VADLVLADLVLADLVLADLVLAVLAPVDRAAAWLACSDAGMPTAMARLRARSSMRDHKAVVAPVLAPVLSEALRRSNRCIGR
jgi:hypothetical protein